MHIFVCYDVMTLADTAAFAQGDPAGIILRGTTDLQGNILPVLRERVTR